MTLDSFLPKIVSIQGDWSGYTDILGFLRFKREGSDNWEYVDKEGGGKWDWDNKYPDSEVITLNGNEFITGINTYNTRYGIKGLSFEIFNTFSKKTSVKFLRSGGVMDDPDPYYAVSGWANGVKIKAEEGKYISSLFL